VMRSSNPVFVPKIQDIRVVASFGWIILKY
jgi:hypothetical protein